ncbi:hypothetical protein ACIBKX_10830 [Streptomyces sp. NPDC050658]|uniref:hypothetical protein n=1 Tax=unclassified Streptomyces TaxID=2593676 RepID=UPI00343AF080
MAAAVAGLLLAEVCAVLPAQIRWADSGDSWSARMEPYQSPLGNLRLLTVSPTLLLGGRSDAVAWAHEALWFTLFAGVLLCAAWAVATRICAGHAGQRRPLVLCLALTAFAPQAHLLALTALRLPDLVGAPAGRGASAQELLEDAREGAAHAVLLALAACAAVALTRLTPRLPRISRRSQHPHRQTPTPLRTTPPRTTRPAKSAALALCATAALGALTSIGAARTVWPAVASWCAYSPEPRPCVEFMVGTLIRPLPYFAMPDVRGKVPEDEFPSYEGPFFLDGSLVSVLVFAVTCAVVAYAVRACVPRGAALTTLLTGWLALTWGAVGYVVPLQYAMDATTYEKAPLYARLGLLIPPDGLQFALLGAPVFAALLALADRLRRAVARSARVAGVTRPDPPPAT